MSDETTLNVLTTARAIDRWPASSCTLTDGGVLHIYKNASVDDLTNSTRPTHTYSPTGWLEFWYGDHKLGKA